MSVVVRLYVQDPGVSVSFPTALVVCEKPLGKLYTCIIWPPCRNGYLVHKSTSWINELAIPCGCALFSEGGGGRGGGL